MYIQSDCQSSYSTGANTQKYYRKLKIWTFKLTKMTPLAKILYAEVPHTLNGGTFFIGQLELTDGQKPCNNTKHAMVLLAEKTK